MNLEYSKTVKVFEKVGVNYSEVFGKFSKHIRNKIPGTKKRSNFGLQAYQL